MLADIVAQYLTPYRDHIVSLIMMATPALAWLIAAATHRRLVEMDDAERRFERHREQAQR